MLSEEEDDDEVVMGAGGGHGHHGKPHQDRGRQPVSHGIASSRGQKPPPMDEDLSELSDDLDMKPSKTIVAARRPGTAGSKPSAQPAPPPVESDDDF